MAQTMSRCLYGTDTHNVSFLLFVCLACVPASQKTWFFLMPVMAHWQVKQRVEKGDIDDAYFSPELWMEIIHNFHTGYGYHPSLGTILLELLRNAEYVTSTIHPELRTVLDSATFNGIPTVNGKGVDMIKDEMMRAFHRYALDISNH